jgi:hypothetical protein
MNRGQFLTRLLTGAAAIAVAPQVLIPKDQPIKMGAKEILAAKQSMTDAIVNMPINQWGGWYSEQEQLAIFEMRKNMEMSMLFGKIERDKNLRFYSGGIWSDQIQG